MGVECFGRVRQNIFKTAFFFGLEQGLDWFDRVGFKTVTLAWTRPGGQVGDRADLKMQSLVLTRPTDSTCLIESVSKSSFFVELDSLLPFSPLDLNIFNIP